MSADGPRLRPLTSADVPALASIDADLFGVSAWSAAMIAEELRAPDRHYVGLECDGVLIGYAGIALAETSQIMTIGVLADHRRRGLGAVLLTNLLEAARGARAREIILEVRASDPVAQRLYERFGFRPVGVRPRYYQAEGADALVMRLPLIAPLGPIGSEVLDA